MGNIEKLVLFLNRKINRLRLSNKNFTIIANTCLGGLIYHQLGEQFCSPTINCGIREPSEFNIFAANLRYYLSLPIDFIPSRFQYPVGVLHGEFGDVTVYFTHYHSEKEAKTKWESRAKRVRYDNVFLLVDGDNCPDQDVYDFDKIPIKNKALISMKEYSGLTSVFTIKNPKYEQGDLLKKKLLHGSLYWFEIFDYVHYFNKGELRTRRLFKNS